MPLCGFNEMMLEGFSLFAQGLFDQAVKRSQEDSVSLEESLMREISEMDLFRSILDTKDDNVQVLKGLTLIAQAIYKKSLNTTAEQIRGEFFKAVAEEKEFCVKLDREYYERLRPRFGPIEALRQLSHWIDENAVSERDNGRISKSIQSARSLDEAQETSQCK